MPSTEVLVIGAGVAGLSAAIALREAGVEVVVIEKSDLPGGRVRSDIVDGFICDRGFQVFNPWYPTAKKLLDYQALALRPLDTSVGIFEADKDQNNDGRGRITFMGDPLRSPGDVVATLRAPLGNWGSLLRLLVYVAKTTLASEAARLDRPDISTADLFRELRLDQDLIDNFLKPFLGGVTLNLELATSRHFTDFVLESFALGTPSLPSGGMGETSKQLAARLPVEAINYDSEVTSIAADRSSSVTVETAKRGERIPWKAKHVVVATDPIAAQELLPLEFEGQFGPVRSMQSVTTWYHVAECPSSDLNDGRSSLLIYPEDPSAMINSLVITNAAPSYSPDGRALISTSRVGLHPGPTADEEIKHLLMKIYGRAASQSSLTFKQIAKYEIPQALPNMVPPWPPHPAPAKYNKAAQSNIVFAGDYTLNGSIEGALKSGLTTAHQII